MAIAGSGTWKEFVERLLLLTTKLRCDFKKCLEDEGLEGGREIKKVRSQWIGRVIYTGMLKLAGRSVKSFSEAKSKILLERFQVSTS